LPATVITELLGVPAEDQARFYRWSNRLVSVSSGHDMPRTLLAALAFPRYLRKHIDRRRAAPRDDLITALVQAEEAGDKLTEDELARQHQRRRHPDRTSAHHQNLHPTTSHRYGRLAENLP
jgi:cytochrome P450 PksS